LHKDGRVTVKLRALQHVGVTVKDLERSVDFFRTAFGWAPIERTAVNQVVSANSAGISGAKLAFFQIGDCLVELLEVTEPRGRELRPTMSDVGAVHLCFEVDDVQRAFETLREQGYKFTGPPAQFETRAMGHFRFVFVFDPDDNPVELYERLRA
jgi:catechol 2,3-dioxygenase-like lactoylglutathione lyase family enzyme